MTPSDGLNIEAVISQFRASEQTLEEVRERLKNILLAEESANRASNNINEAVTTLNSVTLALEQAATELHEARGITLAALEAAKKFLDGTDLSVLRKELEAVGSDTKASINMLKAEIENLNDRVPTAELMRKELEAVGSDTKASINMLKAEIENLNDRVPTAELMRKELEALKLKLPDRVRRKYGIV